MQCPYGGFNQSRNPHWLLFSLDRVKVVFQWGLFVTGGGLEPSWLGRATRCRAPTSTASPCPPTPTSSPTCWGACRLHPCQDCPSAGTAPPHQPVSKRLDFSLLWFGTVQCFGYCAGWLLSDRRRAEGRFTFLCVCPGLPAQLQRTVSCVAPLLRVCAHTLVPASLLVKKGLFHLILFRSFLFERCVCW